VGRPGAGAASGKDAPASNDAGITPADQTAASRAPADETPAKQALLGRTSLCGPLRARGGDSSSQASDRWPSSCRTHQRGSRYGFSCRRRSFGHQSCRYFRGHFLTHCRRRRVTRRRHSHRTWHRHRHRTWRCHRS